MKKQVWIGLAGIFCVGMAMPGSPFQDKGGWLSLFDGKSLSGWRTYQHKPTDSWSVQDGVLYCKGSSSGHQRHADLITAEQFENFELQLAWKIAPAANSGILYLVTEEFPASYESGPEYQLIDDSGYPQKLQEWQKTGANYAMDPPLIKLPNPRVSGTRRPFW